MRLCSKPCDTTRSKLPCIYIFTRYSGFLRPCALNPRLSVPFPKSLLSSRTKTMRTLDVIRVFHSLATFFKGKKALVLWNVFIRIRVLSVYPGFYCWKCFWPLKQATHPCSFIPRDQGAMFIMFLLIYIYIWSSGWTQCQPTFGFVLNRFESVFPEWSDRLLMLSRPHSVPVYFNLNILSWPEIK